MLAEIALQFKSPDLFSLVFFGLTIICSFAAKSVIKGFISAAIGLAIITIGQDPMMGTQRFTFGEVNLIGGIHFLTALIGLFAVPQLVDNFSDITRGGGAAANVTKIKNVFPTLSDLKNTTARIHRRTNRIIFGHSAGRRRPDRRVYQL